MFCGVYNGLRKNQLQVAEYLYLIAQFLSYLWQVNSSRCAFFFTLLVLLLSKPTFAQLNFDFTEGKFLIKGQVRDLKTEAGIAMANIWIPNQKRGIAADADGRFTMYVYPTDTLRFTSLGYIVKTIPIAAIPEKDRYTIVLQLVPDIYSFKTVTIYPFHNKEEFIDAFIKGKGIPQVVAISGVDAPKYIHKEKAQYFNPISAIYNRMQQKKRAANPDFKP